MENYAVNILDLTDPTFAAGPLNMAGMMVGPVTRGRRQVKVNLTKTNPDEMGMILECDDSQAEAIIAMLNMKCLVRAYRKGPRGGWRRLTKAEISRF